MSFCTAINCMDGRVQSPVSDYLRSHFGVAYVDTVTEPGPNAILANGTDATAIASIVRRVDISVTKHGSVGIAIVGHDDCAGNPVTKDEQERHTRGAMAWARGNYPAVPVIGLWVELDGTVNSLD